MPADTADVTSLCQVPNSLKNVKNPQNAKGPEDLLEAVVGLSMGLSCASATGRPEGWAAQPGGGRADWALWRGPIVYAGAQDPWAASVGLRTGMR